MAVPGVFAFFLPVLADQEFGDDDPADWLETGLHLWLVCLAVVATLAVLGGYWRPRMTRRSSSGGATDVDAFAELGLLGTAWPVMVVMTAWLIVSRDADPRWLVWLTGAAAAVGLAAQAHLLASALLQSPRLRQEQHATLAKKRKRR